MAAAVEASTSALGPAKSLPSLTSPTTHFLDTTKALTSTTRQRWIDGEIELNAADASIAALQPGASELKATLASQTTPDLAPTLRDLITSELRYLLAASLGDAVSTGHDSSILLTIYAILDVTTAYQQVDLVDGGLTLTLIEEINERLTVDGACEVFEYLESRAAYLTHDVSPSRGKGLVLLRLLNDLLRRLSKPSRSHLVLSGRILSLLSSVFPLGDRSGVNLRGEFNTANVTRIEETKTDSTIRSSDTPTREQEEENNKDADPSAIAARDDAFYNSFWGLQRYFANPTLLFEPAVEQQMSSDSAVHQQQNITRDPVEKLKSEEAGRSSRSATPGKAKDDAATTATEEEEGATRDETDENADAASSSNTYAPPISPLESFKEATRRVLEVFSEASSREREVEMAEKAANKGTTSTAAAKKRKREEMLQSFLGAQLDVSGTASKDEAQSSFPKYLTGRKVFEYQLRSPPFRRHVLLQYLILFQYLLSFNPNQKEKSKDWKNQQLLLSQPLANEFTLEDSDEKWVRQSWREIVTLLEETGPRNEGRGFKSSVLQTLRRESRWISWKADNCPSIDKPGLKQDLITRFRTSVQDVFFKSRPSFPHSVGTSALSELWEDGLEPIVSGTRIREDDEGNEVRVSTDGLEQLELPPGIPSLGVYAKMIKVQEMKEQMRLRKLGVDPADEKQVNAKRQSDEELKLIREQIDSLNWRALRIARGSSLRLWSKIATGDVLLLLTAEKEEEEAKRRKVEEAEQAEQGKDVPQPEEAATTSAETEAAAPVTEEVTAGTEEAITAEQPTTTEAMQEDDPVAEVSTAAAENDAQVVAAEAPEPEDPPAEEPKTTESVDVPAEDATTTEDTTTAADPDATVYVDASADLGDEDEGEDTYSPTVEDVVPEDKAADADADADMVDAQTGEQT